MSCEVRVIASIEDIQKARKILFPLEHQNGSESWLHSCKISVCPAGDLIVIANERTVVILTPKWDFQSSSSSFYISYNGLIHDYDKVKAILCLTIRQNGSSKSSSDWNCIIVGFDSGFIRCYTENCELIYEEQFNAENIVNITCKKQQTQKQDSPQLEEIYIQYQSVVCILNGPQFTSHLKNCQNESPKSNPDMTLIPKKWGFQEQSIINDSAVVGLSISNTFDHLLTASTCGGFNTKYRSMPPNNTLVIAAGLKPFLGYHYAIEGGGQPVLSDVAKAVASKLKSTLPNWLIGNKSLQEKQMSLAAQPSDPMGCRFGLCDLRRAATDIILSPDHKLAAVCDTLGRILLIDSFKGIVLKIFKGYRDGQCSFIQVPDERKSKHRSGNKVAHFLVIYSPKKGAIEVFSIQQGTRISIFTASKHSTLLYVNYGIDDLTTASKTKTNYKCTTLFIDNDGLIKEIVVPFHFTLSEKNNKKARDLHLYKKFRHFLKSNEIINERILNEASNICTEVKTNDVKCQIVQFLLENKNSPPEFSLNCVRYFLENLEGEDCKNLNLLCQNALVLLKLFIFTLNPCANQKIEELTEFSFKTEVKEIVNLQKLLNLSLANDIGNLAEVHVKFCDESNLTTAQFFSIFNFSLDNCLKGNIEDSLLYKVSEFLFKSYIDGTASNYSELQEKIIDSRIPTKDLLDLLLTYWVNKPLNIGSNLEEQMKRLLTLLNIIVKVSTGKIDVIEYDEVSKFWSQIRTNLIGSPRPFPALMAAILCKYVAQTISKKKDLDESATSLDDMEVLTQEDIEWSLVIGKLEDISLLNIVLSTKPLAKDCPLPKLKYDKVDISLKYILQKGKGSISELVAQWLTTIGFNPQNFILNGTLRKEGVDEEENIPVAEEKFFDNFNLLREQFPFSLETNCLLTNMCWEYATAWQKDMQDLGLLNAAITCLNYVENLQIKQGIYQLLWNAHLKIVNENACKLINKVGKLPKERLCRQDTGLTDYQVSLFLSTSSDFLDSFMETVKASYNTQKEPISFENIWENGGKPLVELAMQQRDVNFELLFLHYQLSLVLLMISTFSVKHSKPINNLFDASIVNLFFTDLQGKLHVSSNKSDVRLNSNRLHFLFKIVLASMESITVNDSGEVFATDHVNWMSKAMNLGKIWNLDVDCLRRYQVVQLFTRGYDRVAEELIPAVNENQELGKCLLIVAAKRLSHFLSASPQLSDNISAFSTKLTKYIKTLDDEWCAPTALQDTTMLATHVLRCLPEADSEYKLATNLLDACKTLELQS